jgi:hypothetical protein
MRTLVGALALVAFLFIAATGAAQWPPCDEQVSVSTTPGGIAIVHDDVEYNCCAWIDVQVEQQPFVVEFYEREQFEFGPCFCMCCFDTEMEVAGLPPGEYTVRLWKVLYEMPPSLVGEWVVTVQGSSDPLVRTVYWPCGETAISDEATAPASWGAIKALYREPATQ